MHILDRWIWITASQLRSIIKHTCISVYFMTTTYVGSNEVCADLTLHFSDAESNFAPSWGRFENEENN